ncbi:hypothetical protein HOG98_09635 [bacterium]|jgi:hypothetical protein|nr:hypothetical protein [bacterium]
MKKTYTFRIDPSVNTKLTQLAIKRKVSKSALCNSILKTHLSDKLDINNDMLLENLEVILPDLKAQKESMKNLKQRIESLIIQSEEAYDHISDMKRGEGFYFKAIYETLKEQKEAFNTLCTAEQKEKVSSKSLDDIYKELDL